MHPTAPTLLSSICEIPQAPDGPPGLEGEDTFKALFHGNAAGLLLCSSDGIVLECNRAAAELFGGADARELTGTNFYENLNISQREQIALQLEETGSAKGIEVRLRRMDRSHLWLFLHAALVEIEGGRLVQIAAFDITQRKLHEQSIADSEAKFRSLADTAASAIYIHDGEHFLFVNRASEAISGYTHDELMAMNPWSLVYPGDLALARGQYLSTLADRTVPNRFEFRVMQKGGALRWVDFTAAAINYDGRQCVLATSFDTSERKRSEQLQSALYRIATLANSADELQGLLRSIHQALSELMYARNLYIAVLAEEGTKLRFLYFADESEPMPSERFLGRGLSEYVLRTGAPLLADVKKTEELEQAGELELLGSPCVDWLGAPLRVRNKITGLIALQSYDASHRYSNSDLEVLAFVAQHIGVAIERERNRDALLESEHRHRSLLQSAVYGIYRASVDDRFLYVNPALVRMLGYEAAEELLAMRLARDLYVDGAERVRLVEQLRRSRKVENAEVSWRRKDGRQIIVRLSGTAVRSDEDELTAFEMIVEDVTERRALEEQLRQSQKMEAVGRLAGGISHEFNNLLTIIKGYSELLLDDLAPGEPMQGELTEIRKASERAAGLTRQLLAFSRQQVASAKLVDVNGMLRGMERVLVQMLGEKVRLEMVLQPGLGAIHADPAQIEQVIMNLAVNARDACSAGGTVRFETAHASPVEIVARDSSEPATEDHVLLTVSDDGEGMPEEVRSRAFEPFFTTKEPGKGTGLGLSTVYGIVKESKGQVTLTSAAGAGTSVSVYLPRVD